MRLENKNPLDIRCELTNKTDTSVDLYLYGTIVNEKPTHWFTGEELEGDYIYSEKIRNLVDEAGDREINLHINSTGGNIYASIAISNYLNQIDNKVNVYIDGIAGSGASIIAMAGDEINMPVNTTMMIHRAAASVYGNAEDLRKTADTLDKFDETVLNSYKKRFVGEVSELQSLIEDETYLTANECKVLGLCDNLLNDIEIEDEEEPVLDIKNELLNKYANEEEFEIVARDKNLFSRFKKKER